MKILGISSDFHDSSAALVIDGQLVASAAEERFTRNKHDSHFPKFAIDFCLEQGDLTAQDLDRVIYYERPIDKWIRVLESSLSNWPNSRSEFVESQSEWLGRKLWTRATISRFLGISPSQVREVSHHTSHVLQAFVGSPFDSAAVLTVDAVGERSTASMAKLSWSGDKLNFIPLGNAQYPHSLGLFYSAMTAFLGFKPMNDECTVMALAAFGQPLYVDFFRKVLECTEDGFWQIDSRFLQFDRFLREPWTPEMTAVLGPPRTSSSKLSWSSLAPNAPSEADHHWAAVAASVQIVFQDAVLHSARHLFKKSGEKNLCFAGGAALNCVANSILARDSGFADLFIPVEPGDGGASIGAAFAGCHLHEKTEKRSSTYSVFMGKANKFDPTWVQQFDVEHTWEYQKHGMKPDRRIWDVSQLLSSQELIKTMAKLLAEGKVLAWTRGRFELGPRALGHRSILFRADSPALAARVSQDIKDRARYRPYALAFREEDSDEILVASPLSSSASPLRWMQLAVDVHPSMKDVLRAGLHVDGTTRPQVVVKSEDPQFHSLLTHFKTHCGVGALVNTSFNESGYPLVHTPEEALHFFARTNLDALVIDDVLIRKVEK